MKKMAALLVVLFVSGCGPTYEDGLKLKSEGDFKGALEIFEREAEDGHLQSTLELIEWYQKSEPQKAFIWRQEAAKLGDAANQAYVGWAHDGGDDIPDSAKQPELAYEYYEKSANQGNASGEFYLGYSYARGYGVEKNETKAVEWYLKGAEQGELNALHFLGFAYYKGLLGLEVKHKTAVGYLCRASKAGNSESAPLLKQMWVNEILIPAYNDALKHAEAPQGVKGVYAYSGQKESLYREARKKKVKINQAKQATNSQVVAKICN